MIMKSVLDLHLKTHDYRTVAANLTTTQAILGSVFLIYDLQTTTCILAFVSQLPF